MIQCGFILIFITSVLNFLLIERVNNNKMSDFPIVTHEMKFLSLIKIGTWIPMAPPYGLGDL